jgi:hypothetical protein
MITVVLATTWRVFELHRLSGGEGPSALHVDV